MKIPNTQTLQDICDCKAPALYTCNWQVRRSIVVPLPEIVVGDVLDGERLCPSIFDWSDGHAGRAIASYPVIERLYSRDGKAIYLTVAGKNRTGILFRSESYCSGLPVFRIVNCGNPCCEQHVREVDQQRHYCQYHWNSWMDISL